MAFHAAKTPLRLAACAAALAGLALPASAGAATPIGQLAPGNPPEAFCTDPDDNTEFMQSPSAGGSTYVVPPGGVAITSWSTRAAAGTGQVVKLKVFRNIAFPATFQVVAQDALRALAPGVVNTFPVNIPVQPGDRIGMTIGFGSADNACVFDSPGNTVLSPPVIGDFENGESVVFSGGPDFEDALLNLAAVVGFKASNDIDFLKVKKNKNKGTATLTVDVPGPGQLSLTGAGVKPQRAGGATISKEVTEAGKVKLRIKAKGAKKEKLFDRGKVKVKVKVTFKPAASGGDVAGDPNTDPKRVKLVLD